MNELLFFSQVFLVASFVFGAVRLGREGLTAWVAIQAIIANLFVLKQISLFGFTVTASDAFAIGSLLGLNFLQERFGKDAAQKATWVCFFFMIFFTLASQLHLLYEPSAHDQSHPAYNAILLQAPRLLIASMCVFFVVQQIDIRFFKYLKESFPTISFGLRSTLALLVSQTLDTILFSIAGLYGIVNSLADIILLSLAIKYLVIFLNSSILRWTKP